MLHHKHNATVSRERNVRSQRFPINTECQCSGNEQSAPQFGFPASNSCISHPDVMGNGHSTRPQLKCEGMRRGAALHHREFSTFTSSSHRFLSVHLHLQHTRSSGWLWRTAAHHSFKPGTELRLNQTALNTASTIEHKGVLDTR